MADEYEIPEDAPVVTAETPNAWPRASEIFVVDVSGIVEVAPEKVGTVWK